MEFLEQKLPNGLEIIAERNPQAHSTAVGFFVRTGARDEEVDVSGVSHFLEHMVFKGTPTRTADDVNREFDEMGAHYNAFTSDESTVYYAAVLPEHQDDAVGLLSDIMRPSLRPEDFDTEKQVIIEEIRMYEDQPPFGADEKCKELHFYNHRLGNSILGTVDSVGALTPEAMRAYFSRRYSPSNMMLAAAGRIDFDALVYVAEKCCGAWPDVRDARDLRPVEPRSHFASICRDTAAQQYVIELHDAPAADDPDRFAAKVLAAVLGDESGSRMYWELVDAGRVEHASLTHYEYLAAGCFMTYLSCDPAHTADNMRRVLSIFRQAEAEGVAAEEIDQVKSKINSRLVLGGEKPSGRLFTVGNNWLQRREYRTVAEEIADVDAVTAADVARVLAKYPLTRSTTLTIGPLEHVDPPE